MGRRKVLGTVTLESGGSYTGWSDAGVCSLEFLQQKYDQALTETRATTLYADTTKCHIERMEKLWTEYCAIFDLEPRETLRECQTARMENFLHWVLKTCTIKKTSAVTTYWRQLSQLHITWWQCRIAPQTLKEIFVFIEGSLTKEYGLDNTESEKPLLEAEEFMEVIQYHWAADINIFPNERQRVQVAAILLLAAYTGSRPGALLNITYRDLRLYVEKHRKTGKHELKLAVTLTKTKSGQKRKRPKTYIFHLDENPVFCIITHMISIAFDDEAYNVPELVSPQLLFSLKAKKGPSQTVPWKPEMLDIPVFRRAIKTKDGVETSKDAPLTYRQYHGWLVLLGVALGFIYTLTTYCLRRALGNAINDDPNSNAAVRNLVLDHGTGSKIFERNYISRTIRYFTQDQFWGRSSDHESARTASQIGLLRDPDRPRKLSTEQGQQVRQDPEVRILVGIRSRLCAQIEEVFGVIEMAKGEPIYNDYQAVKASLAATIRKKERALLKQIQEEYDLNAPVLAIQQQLNGEQSNDDDDDDDKEDAPIETAPIRIAERRYIAECAVRDPSVLRNQKGYAFHVEFSINLIALCKRRDRRPAKTECSPEPVPVKTALDSPRLSEIEPSPPVKRDTPLKCQGWQCLFCLASYDLPVEERECKYKRKYTLQKHVDRCRLRYFGPDDLISCPDNHACAGLILEGKMALKAHFAREHGCIL